MIKDKRENGVNYIHQEYICLTVRGVFGQIFIRNRNNNDRKGKEKNDQVSYFTLSPLTYLTYISIYIYVWSGRQRGER